MPAAVRSAAPIHAVSLVVAAGIATLLLLPFPAPSFAPGWGIALPLDKVGHFALFLFAALPWRRSMAALDFRRPGIVTLLVASAFAGLLELAQGALTATRVPEWLDLLAGAAGAGLGAWLARRVELRAPRRTAQS